MQALDDMALLRLTLTRGPGNRGYTPDAVGRPTVLLTLHPAPRPAHSAGWSLVTSSFRIPGADPLSMFKTTSKILQIMARAEAVAKGADEALLLNTNGDVAETAGGNLFWIHQGRICTAPAEFGVLPGITRAVVLEICQDLGLPTGEPVIRPPALKHAEGLFVTQSGLGIAPVAMFDGEPVPRSPRVAQIAAGYDERLARE